MRSELKTKRALAPLLVAVALPALAHVDDAAGGSGFVAGLLHPVLGPDHLLAMVAIGMWGAVLGRPLLIALPITFPLMMLMGAVLALLGIDLPAVEAGIALSVVVLGAAMLFAWRAPPAIAVLIVGLFGLCHGHAHGTELPDSVAPSAYAAGFLIATGALHLAGIAFGTAWTHPVGQRVLRATGALVGAAGFWFLLKATALG